MNILDILTLLQEEMAIEKYREKAEGSVPTEVMDKLASKMRKGKFDNTAMAIMKTIQSLKDKEKRDYLINHPVAVYTIIRKSKAGNDKFNPQEILDNFSSSNLSPREFWKNALQTKPVKQEKTGGLNNAIIKKSGDEFLIFPKTAKTINEYGFSADDFDKQWKELKAISDELARRDTSGEDGANVNHWCVASSSGNFYTRYKEDGGIFIVILKKKKDGKPDYNNRYLLFMRTDPSSYDEGVEFADKFDEYFDPEDILSKPTIKLLEKITNDFNDKKERSNEEIQNRIYNAIEDLYNDDSRFNSEDAQIMRKLYDHIEKKVKEAGMTAGKLANKLKKLPLDSFEEYFKKNAVNNKIDLGEITIGFEGKFFVIRDKKDNELESYYTNDLEIAQAFLNKLTRPRDPERLLSKENEMNSKENINRILLPFNFNKEFLKNNKNIEKIFNDEKRKLTSTMAMILRGKIGVRRNDNERKYEVVTFNDISQRPFGNYLCDIRDKNLFKKVDEFLERG